MDIDFLTIEDDRMAWSLRTFKEATPVSSLNKCRSELDEIESNIRHGKRDPEEHADA